MNENQNGCNAKITPKHEEDIRSLRGQLALIDKLTRVAIPSGGYTQFALASVFDLIVDKFHDTLAQVRKQRDYLTRGVNDLQERYNALDAAWREQMDFVGTQAQEIVTNRNKIDELHKQVANQRDFIHHLKSINAELSLIRPEGMYSGSGTMSDLEKAAPEPSLGTLSPDRMYVAQIAHQLIGKRVLDGRINELFLGTEDGLVVEMSVPPEAAEDPELMTAAECMHKAEAGPTRAEVLKSEHDRYFYGR